MIKVLQSRFVKSCAKLAQAPQIKCAEIAILGRSNVGKSSLINALLNRKNLAKSSSTPGKTRLVNFFESKWRISDSCEATKSRPLRGAKNRIQGCSSATADFLLEADKRGSPPKSEKATAFWRVGGAGRGVQPFLRKETHESRWQNDESNADSLLGHCDSYNLDSRDLDCFGDKSPRNDRQNDSPLQYCDSYNLDSRDLDSSLRATRFAQNDESMANSRTLSSQTEFTIHILDFPGFGYAKVSKAEKDSWDKNLSAFLMGRESIKLFIHLIDSRHTDLKIDGEIRAFLQSILRADADILEVFTKADKLKKSEIHALKGKILVSTIDKNSVESLRCAILQTMYHIKGGFYGFRQI